MDKSCCSLVAHTGLGKREEKQRRRLELRRTRRDWENQQQVPPCIGRPILDGEDEVEHGGILLEQVVVFANATCGCSFCTLDSRLVISLPGPVTAGFLLVRSADPNLTSSKPPWLQKENHLQRGPFSCLSCWLMASYRRRQKIHAGNTEFRNVIAHQSSSCSLWNSRAASLVNHRTLIGFTTSSVLNPFILDPFVHDQSVRHSHYSPSPPASRRCPSWQPRRRRNSSLGPRFDRVPILLSRTS
ncbi:hypothetical protein BKA56DRAFT_220591 [Ilyonectria sp. MPI-CAGE-AT-0026]|nr:hypothetical protein BKA56DRAFT_220591 [Ilyonectria sp. MPI-CAGE-AT-0026]